LQGAGAVFLEPAEPYVNRLSGDREVLLSLCSGGSERATIQHARHVRRLGLRLTETREVADQVLKLKAKVLPAALSLRPHVLALEADLLQAAPELGREVLHSASALRAKVAASGAEVLSAAANVSPGVAAQILKAALGCPPLGFYGWIKTEERGAPQVIPISVSLRHQVNVEKCQVPSEYFT
jgi:hypothetical protein